MDVRSPRNRGGAGSGSSVAVSFVRFERAIHYRRRPSLVCVCLLWEALWLAWHVEQQWGGCSIWGARVTGRFYRVAQQFRPDPEAVCKWCICVCCKLIWLLV
ncbi:uncharacterized protein YALI1_E19754g [Yarrowia lipolytica]|uniref:Uncharacterized protein n=1 Tax=Yarrowia lipolytica TaxID=4952 RepID=A0A1D8NIR1_YARLL|nr:hypothetical protein YALI1_E19754g [Yarrowia lipolytica]